MQSSKLILVTGSNGFVGAHVVRELLEQGYRVRAAVRSHSAAEKVAKAHAKYHDELTTAIVPDITVKGAFDETVKGVHGVMHVATPYNLNLTGNVENILNPAIKGTEGILESVYQYGSDVTRVVITSSFIAIFNPFVGSGTGQVYTEADWNPITYEAARDGNSVFAYMGAKTLSERAAWDFMDRLRKSANPPKFDISVLNPPFIHGPSVMPLDFGALGTSTGDINRLIDSSSSEVPPPSYWPFVDVRDVATAHRRAFEVPAAGGQRFLICNHMFGHQQVCDILHASDRIPDAVKAKIPVGKPGENYPGPGTYTADSSKSRTILGIEYGSLERAVVDAALDIIKNREEQDL